MLGGIVAAAAGVEQIPHDPEAPAGTAAAWFLSGGVAALLGLAAFRRVLRTGGIALRIAAAALALAASALGTLVAGVLQLTALAALLLALVLVERALERRRGVRLPA